jgi:hypothetical protein
MTDNEVPKLLIEKKEPITAEQIRKTRDLAHREYLIKRFGRQRFSILEHWQEWRNCRSRPDFEPFVACGLDRAFAAVSKRISAYAEAAVARLSPADLCNPRIEKDLVAAALARFLVAWGEHPRRVRWFESASAARAYIRKKAPSICALPIGRACAWHLSSTASGIEAIWMRTGRIGP